MGAGFDCWRILADERRKRRERRVDRLNDFAHLHSWDLDDAEDLAAADDIPYGWALAIVALMAIVAIVYGVMRVAGVA